MDIADGWNDITDGHVLYAIRTYDNVILYYVHSYYTIHIGFVYYIYMCDLHTMPYHVGFSKDP